MQQSQSGEGQPFPPPESQGGWQALDAQAGISAGLDERLIRQARAWHASLGAPAAVVIVRAGRLVSEWYEQGAAAHTRFNIYSCTKSFTSTAYGMALADARRGALPGGVCFTLDSAAYTFIPAGRPLSDPRKGRITLRHLLSMTSGIAGESVG